MRFEEGFPVALTGQAFANRVELALEANRIGQLHVRNLDIRDSRDKLGIYAKAGVLPPGPGAAGLPESPGEKKKA